MEELFIVKGSKRDFRDVNQDVMKCIDEITTFEGLKELMDHFDEQKLLDENTKQLFEHFSKGDLNLINFGFKIKNIYEFIFSIERKRKLIEKFFVKNAFTEDTLIPLELVFPNDFEKILDKMEEAVDEIDDNWDNERVYLKGDIEAKKAYKQAIENGCCGFYEDTISVNGKHFKIGFNYGH